MGWVISSFMDEILERMAEETNPEMLEGFLVLTAQIMKWVATGNPYDLPEEYRKEAIFVVESVPEIEAEVAH